MSEPDFDASNALEEVVAFYGLGDLQSFRFAANGIENLNYFIQTKADSAHNHQSNQLEQAHRSHQYVVSFLVKPPFSGDAYVDMMYALDEAGLPVAPPIRNANRESSATYAEKAAMLQRCISGRHTLNPTLKQVRSLGRFMAHMHRTMQRSNIQLPAYPRDATWLQSHAEKVSAQLPYTDKILLQESVTRLSSLLSRADTASLPQGMIHGDLFRDNVLFSEKGLTGVLDFHHAAHGFWIYDLAVAANDWCSDNSGVLDIDRTTELLRAYHAVRPLQQEEVWLLPIFGLYAAVSFWVSRLLISVPALQSRSEQLSTDQPTVNIRHRTKNPDEMKAIVQHHTRHQFYLDMRRLD